MPQGEAHGTVCSADPWDVLLDDEVIPPDPCPWLADAGFADVLAEDLAPWDDETFDALLIAEELLLADELLLVSMIDPGTPGTE
ncbi:MAG: hypothetical protein ABI310_07275, partial [Microbacteriaceae bacterium]